MNSRADWREARKYKTVLNTSVGYFPLVHMSPLDVMQLYRYNIRTPAIVCMYLLDIFEVVTAFLDDTNIHVSMYTKLY